VNKACADIDPVFAGIPMLNFPYSEMPLIGMNNLQQFLKANYEVMEKQMSVC
jgi:hypothetical protein